MDFLVDRFDFDKNVFSQIDHIHQVKDLWPVVYILSDGKVKLAYVGETTDANARLSSHLSNSEKKKLNNVYLIRSEKFNKSATLDIESNLIRYLSGDGEYQLLNANLGIANHNYYQKPDLYWDIFKGIWNKLRSEGVAKHSIEYINNSDLFKYSPYKSLSPDQKQNLLEMLRSVSTGEHKQLLVQGGAGTGKTVLAIYLFKLLLSEPGDFNYQEFGEEEQEFIKLVSETRSRYPELNLALVVPMASFRKTLQRVFKNIKGLKPKMVIGPAEVVEKKYDIIMVDESHRLRRRVNLGAYYGAFDKAAERLGFDKTCNELDWILKQSNQSILFYDSDQSIKPSDVKTEDFKNLLSKRTTRVIQLKSQFRVKGGNDYVKFVDDLLNTRITNNIQFVNPQYECLLFDSLTEMIDEIGKREKEHQLSRLIAGYSWEWISKDNKSLFDIEIGDVKLQWNSVNIDWVNSTGAQNEVGCIHTTQGYDLNYAGIIFGNEISFNKTSGKIEVRKENYFDKNGKQSIKDQTELHQFILNIYKTIMLRSIRGTYIYVCNPELREYFKKHITSFISSGQKLSVLKYQSEKFENSIPLFSLKVAAGEFGVTQNPEELNWVPLPNDIKYSDDLFTCRVVGESMNKIIPNNSICLFRKYSGGSRSGLIILAECTDLQDPDSGSSYTVKQYESLKKENESDEWSHQRIILNPVSSKSEYEPIILDDDEIKRFRTIGIFERVLGI